MEAVSFPAPASPRRSSPLATLSPNVPFDERSAEPGKRPSVEPIDLDADGSQPDGEEEEEDKPALHIEVRLQDASRIRTDTLSRLVRQYLFNNFSSLVEETVIDEWQEIRVLNDNVEQDGTVLLEDVSLDIHIYRAIINGQQEDLSAASSQVDQDDVAADGEDVSAASVCDLPLATLEGVWESLIYEADIKRRLLNYIAATMEFSDCDVSFNIIAWHRLVLLHGPPGTGKTSLCRALAQKLAIRLGQRYSSGKLVEINAHSLFSKWFSESGKLVQRLFARVTELCHDDNAFVVVLIDEVESLTAARAGAMSGKEPSDALRVVNALLTQLDKLKLRKNVLVLTTSNLSSAIDTAFLDRADIKLFIPTPPLQAAYAILASCLTELCRSGLVRPCSTLDWPAVSLTYASGLMDDDDAKISVDLRKLAAKCEGMSGRTLRRLPVLAHARFVMTLGGRSRRDAASWITAMAAVVEQENAEQDLVDRPSNV